MVLVALVLGGYLLLSLATLVFVGALCTAGHEEDLRLGYTDDTPVIPAPRGALDEVTLQKT